MTNKNPMTRTKIARLFMQKVTQKEAKPFFTSPKTTVKAGRQVAQETPQKRFFLTFSAVN